MAKFIVIVGVTGGQGSSVVKALLSNPSYKIRGITRNTTSDNAKALTAKGVEMGANIIFAFTNFFEAFATQGPDPAIEIEYAQGLNLAKAASKIPTLEHYIWSTLPDSSVISNGAIVVPHFQAKAAIDEYIKKDATLLEKTTFLWCSCFSDTFAFPILLPNFLKSAGKYIQLSPCKESTPVVFLGNYKHNIGIFVEAIVAKPHLTLPGKYVLASTETLTKGGMLEKWSTVTSKQAEYVQVSLEKYNAIWPMWGREFALNLKLWSEFTGNCWGPGSSIGKEELGIKNSLLIGVEQAFKETDWSVLL